MANGNYDIGFGYGGFGGNSPFNQYGSQGSPFATGNNFSLGNTSLDYSSPTYTPMQFDFSQPGAKPPPGGGGGSEKSGSGGGSSTNWSGIGQGASTFASGAADFFNAPNQALEQRGKAQLAEQDINQFFDRYKAGEFDARLDQKMLDYFSMGRRGTDLTPTLSAMATGLDVASQDPRALAASLPGMTSSASKTMQDIARQDFERDLSMAGQEGQAYQGVRDANLAYKQQLYGDKLAEDKAAYAQAIQNAEAFDQAGNEAIFNMISGAGQMIGGGFGMGEKGMKIPEYQEGGDIMSQIMAAQGQGGVPARQDLPGPESHEENPIDMVAPNGEKVGEATGGEIILNSEQTENIEEAVAVVDQAIESGEQPSLEQLMAVYESVSETLSQPQFQDKQQAPEASEERKRMMMMLGGGEQVA